jgi:uncharacterized membrane protein YhaH (DUF805 family)
MKWFIKVLGQYADFSGRAQRKEFWMFMLFYVALMADVILIEGIFTDFKMEAPLVLFVYLFVMILPSLAVTVRRLHDVGKSGWWILVRLIPIAGNIGLLIWLFQDSQKDGNRYGDNPKTTPQQAPSEKAQLTGAGVILIFVSAFYLIADIVFLLAFRNAGENITPFVNIIIRTILHLLLLFTGILLLIPGDSHISPVEGAKRRIFAPLLIYGVIMTILFIVDFIVLVSTFSHGFLDIASYLTLMLQNAAIVFFASVLISSKKLFKTASIILIALSAIIIVRSILANIGVSALSLNPHDFLYSVTITLFSISLIVLARVFMSNETATGDESTDDKAYLGDDNRNTYRPPVSQPTPATSGEKTYYERDNRGMRVETMDQSIAYWIGERMQSIRKDPFVYYIFKNMGDARNAMLALPFIHLASDTGEIICDEVFRFGYFAVTNNGLFTGEYDAFVTGADFTLEQWKKTDEIFAKYNGVKKNDLKPEANSQTVPSAVGDVTKVQFVREDRDNTSVWRVFKASCKADAIAFLAEQTVIRPLFYIVVETPEGNFGKDKDGIYQE